MAQGLNLFYPSSDQRLGNSPYCLIIDWFASRLPDTSVIRYKSLLTAHKLSHGPHSYQLESLSTRMHWRFLQADSPSAAYLMAPDKQPLFQGPQGTQQPRMDSCLGCIIRLLCSDEKSQNQLRAPRKFQFLLHSAE